ncbi:hypothetical protein B0H19DRAFT_1129421 [Mycena capillaripes]|nr:hypothetical protein B0H19DRAFT_1129421 [Mycena capillaripes]
MESRTVDCPKLPRELERIIFEMAALSRPCLIPTLILVAWRIKDWLEPLLYRAVMVSAVPPRQLLGFHIFRERILLRAIDNKPPAFFQNHVRHLFLENAPNREDMEAILTACDHVTHLVFLVRSPSPFLPVLASLQCLQRFTIGIEALFTGWSGVDFAHPVFRNITHLELLETYYPDVERISPGLLLVPHLTHIAFNIDLPPRGSPLDTQLRADARLMCIIFLARPWIIGQYIGREVDERVVCIDRRTEYREQWLRSADTGSDYWALAEEFIAAKRIARVDRARYIISDADDSWRS